MFLDELRAKARQVINIPSPGQDQLCGETKRYAKRLFRGTGQVASLRRTLRAVWDTARALIS